MCLNNILRFLMKFINCFGKSFRLFTLPFRGYSMSSVISWKCLIAD